MKKIAVVATEKEYAEYLKNSITRYLGRYADFKSYSIEEVEKAGMLTEDFILISAFNVFQKVRQKVSGHSEIMVLTLSLSKKQMENLKWIPRGTKALLVNFDNRCCMHTITSLYEAGFRDVELFPYYGQGSYDKSIKLAITPNEEYLVPKGIETIINVGESSVSVNSLYDIADKLGVYEEFSQTEAREAYKEYYYINSGMEKLLNEKTGFTDKLNALIKMMNEGIIIADITGKIYLSNEKAEKLLHSESHILRGFNVSELLPAVRLGESGEKLVKTSSCNIVASSVEIKSNEEVVGYIITLADFEEVEEKQHTIRGKISEADHTARYAFGDIIGESELIKSALEKAKRFAKSDSAVLITGESGTGKEMFAQGIHNASGRRDYNFVAVNCAAIPENLLESEMFGYSEGSFTGAKKGGKLGFFELAHKGTIFLDEIGEMPLQLQSKLLRVLEEKKVMRVGSMRNISVDVRIIAATNKNLFELVKKGRFREDLYYRLNVLPLKLPPLRERKEDIMAAVGYFTDRMKASFLIDEEAKAALLSHRWSGNMRELRNVMEFLVNQDKKIISLSDLPFEEMYAEALPARKVQECAYDKKTEAVSDGAFTESESGENFCGIHAVVRNELYEAIKYDAERLILNEGRNLRMFRRVLKIMKKNADLGHKAGRSSILEELQKELPDVTDGEVRGALKKLTGYGFAEAGKGRGGSRLTAEGRILLKYLEECDIGFIGK